MNKLKKLILFSYDFPPSTGGIARLCQEIVVGMQYYYEDIIVLTRQKSGVNIPYNDNKVKVIELPNQRIRCELSAIKFLSNIKNKNEYDLLCGIWHPEGFLARLAGFNKIYVLGHGMEFLSGNSWFRKYFWHKVYAKYILQKIELVICNSHFTEKILKEIHPNISTKVLTLAVNTSFFSPQKSILRSNKLKICTVSRIEKFKGHDFIARVIAKLPSEVLNGIHWQIAGIGPDLNYLKGVVTELGINEHVSFVGFIPDNELPKFYSDNDLFILCSRESSGSSTVEGFGLVYLEAQSCGTPAIGTKTGGIPDAIIEGEGGWLIDQDNEADLTRLLLLNYNDRKYLKIMADKGLDRVKRQATWDIYCEKLYNIMSV